MMKQHNSIANRIIRVAVALLTAAALFSFAACSNEGKTGVRVIGKVQSRNMISAQVSSAEHHLYNPQTADKEIASSGLLKLYVDGQSNSFCVLETSQNSVWSALPVSSDDVNVSMATDASVVELTVVGGTDVYYLNSQDNSVAYGTARYEQLQNGVKLIYNIFADAATSEKSRPDKTDIAFCVTVAVELIDGSMFIKCEYSNLSGNPDAYVEDIGLLNYFGAYSRSTPDDFVLVPDGCGAIIKTAINDDSFEPLSFPVYGDDPSAAGKASSGNAIVPAFGIKRGSSAFVALIEGGDAIATVNADKAVESGEFNRVNASFNVTPVVYEDEKLYISTSSYHGDISLCYRFVSGSNATYGGLASACREQLIRNSTLSTGKVSEAEGLPFNLTVTGAVSKTVFGSVGILNKVTDFDQAQDMLTRLKSKGVDNINLRIMGAFSGGVNSKEICSAGLLRRLGGTASLAELYKYTSAQKMSLFLDVNLLSSSSGFASSQGNAQNIFKQSSSYQLANPLGDAAGSKSYNRQLRSLNKFSEVIVKLLSGTRYYSFSGYCINDAGSLLYSDYSSAGSDRETASNTIANSLSPLATNRTTMAVGGNFYMLRNINVIVDLPLKTSVAQSGAYLSVPFVQLILHGILDYSGDPINMRTNYEETLLRCIEYGASPQYRWNYSPIADNADKDVFYCDNSINDAVELYAAVNQTLGDLRSARITDHYQVSDGVYCTEYDTGTMIYVNYSANDYETMGVLVSARSYIRIN